MGAAKPMGDCPKAIRLTQSQFAEIPASSGSYAGPLANCYIVYSMLLLLGQSEPWPTHKATEASAGATRGLNPCFPAAGIQLGAPEVAVYVDWIFFKAKRSLIVLFSGNSAHLRNGANNGYGRVPVASWRHHADGHS